MKNKAKHFLIFSLIIITYGCKSFFSPTVEEDGVSLPFIKNSANECYYLDEFMPLPNNLVTGKTGALNLRYYTYNSATYKEWLKKGIVLSFYSKDDRCWSLFEEFFFVR